jgi:hypothetical protein
LLSHSRNALLTLDEDVARANLQTGSFFGKFPYEC